MDGPPGSLDLNLTENVWAMLKKRVKNMTRDPSKWLHNVLELASITQEEWEHIEWLKVNRLIERMLRRVKTVNNSEVEDIQNIKNILCFYI
jgi:guanylate kinase